jgi:hypothetical protein
MWYPTYPGLNIDFGWKISFIKIVYKFRKCNVDICEKKPLEKYQFYVNILKKELSDSKYLNNFRLFILHRNQWKQIKFGNKAMGLFLKFKK